MAGLKTEKCNGNERYQRVDKVWGIISLSLEAKTIIKHRLFKRLKDIRQLGTLSFIYPNATHSRFEHSLGVAYLAYHTAKSLQKIHPEITDLEILCVELAGLCHDIGHGAFSHVLDMILKAEVEDNLNICDKSESCFDKPDSCCDKLDLCCDKFNKLEIKNNSNDSRETNYKNNAHHEMRSIIILKQIFLELNKKNILLDEGHINLICYFIDNKAYKKLIGEPLPHYFKGLEQIVNNDEYKLDVDKMDYIERDAYALSINTHLTKKLNILEMLSKTCIIGGVWVFDITDQAIIQELFCRRLIFHTNYYASEYSNIITCMISDALLSAVEILNIKKFIKMETITEINLFSKMTDENIINDILNNSKLVKAQALINRVIKKENLYTYLGEFTHNANNHYRKGNICDSSDDHYQKGNICDSSDNSKKQKVCDDQNGGLQSIQKEIVNAILYDSSSPMKAVPKVLFHNNRLLIHNIQEYINVRRFQTS